MEYVHQAVEWPYQSLDVHIEGTKEFDFFFHLTSKS
jgi:hypothetical protein